MSKGEVAHSIILSGVQAVTILEIDQTKQPSKIGACSARNTQAKVHFSRLVKQV